MQSSEAARITTLLRASRVGSGLVVGLGGIVLFGWALELHTLTRVHPSLASMKVNTAVSFVLLGSAIWLARNDHHRRARRALALAIILVAGASAVEYLMEVDLGIDQLLIADEPDRTASASAPASAPGRMAQVTSMNFLALGFSILALDARRSRLRHVRHLVLVTATTSFVALLGYIYGARALQGVGPYASIALHTTVGFLTACFALVAARPRESLMSLVASDTSAGVIARRLVPALWLVLILLGSLWLWAQREGAFAPSFGIAVLVASTTVILSLVTWTVATSLYGAEIEQATIQRRSKAVLRSALDAIVWMDHRGNCVEFNPAAERLFGYSRSDVIGRSVSSLIVPPALRDAHDRAFERHLRTGESSVLGRSREVRAMRRDGSEFTADLSITRVADEEPALFTAFIRDVSEREQVERMRERDQFFQLSLDMVCIANATGHLIQVSPAFERVLGYSEGELRARPFLELVHPEDRPATVRELDGLVSGHPTLDFHNRCRRKDGTYRLFQWRAAPDMSGLIYAVARDVTDDMAARDVLQASLKEREVLLQEVHHRVKNNLQVISSLINMQVRKLDEGRGRDALEECQRRVQTIALIHEKLYQSKDYGRVPFSEYTRELAENIVHAAGVATHHIALAVTVDVPWLPVDKAIPCGLILNELISNAVKHAFPGERRGTLCVELRQTGDREILLSVADDGVGLSQDLDPATSTSLGLQVVSTLVAQLRGRLAIERGRGTTFRVVFPHEARS